jgi:hypothetical protein
MEASLLKLPRVDRVGKCESGPLDPRRHQCAKVEVCVIHLGARGPVMKRTTIGLDLAKRVFQVHVVDRAARTDERVRSGPAKGLGSHA